MLCPDLVLQSPADSDQPPLVGRWRRDSTSRTSQQHQKSPPAGSGAGLTGGPSSRRPGAVRAGDGGAAGLEDPAAGGTIRGEISKGCCVEAAGGDRSSTASTGVQTRDSKRDLQRSTTSGGPPPTTPGRAKNGSDGLGAGGSGGGGGGGGGGGRTGLVGADAEPAAGSSTQQDLLLLYFLRLMDGVAQKEYVVLLCGGGGAGGAGNREDRAEGGRGRWLSWARFSFLGQIHSLLPRR